MFITDLPGHLTILVGRGTFTPPSRNGKRQMSNQSTRWSHPYELADILRLTASSGPLFPPPESARGFSEATRNGAISGYLPLGTPPN